MNERRRIPLQTVLILVVLTASLAQAAAQTPAQAPVPLPPEVPGRPRGAEPSPPSAPQPYYDPALDRLAELMGTLAYMRKLCGKDDGAPWRDKMAALIEAEGTAGATNQRLAGSYNRGFRGYQLTYRSCTPAAQEVMARALEEGQRLSKTIARHMGVD